MKHKWIILVADEEGEWTVLDNTDFEPQARETYQELRDQGDMSPMILLYTGDFAGL